MRQELLCFTLILVGSMIGYFGLGTLDQKMKKPVDVPYEESVEYRQFKKQREEERARCLQNPYCAMKDTLAEFDYEQTQKGKL